MLYNQAHALYHLNALLSCTYPFYYLFRAWYAIVKIGPGNCGKVYICINSLRSVQTLTIVAVHPTTHKLLCPGEIKKLP